MSKLLIISNMSHHRRNDRIVGHGSTVREIDALATLFDQVEHLGCLHNDRALNSELPYTSDRVHLIPLPPAGGSTIRAKLDIIRHLPLYMHAIWRELQRADVVHVRAPANIPLIALLLLALTHKPTVRWVKYAGTWKGYSDEPYTYRLQRTLIRLNLHRGWVTVNGTWNAQPEHVLSMVNPCLTQEEIGAGRVAAAQKRYDNAPRLIFVGHLTKTKGVHYAIDAAAELLTHLDIVGDGPERAALEDQVRHLGVENRVHFWGALQREQINQLYATAHFVLLPSKSEGWPKVLSEGMAFGAVPLATAVGSIPSYLVQFGTGMALREATGAAFAGAVRTYNTERWQRESLAALSSAALFSYEHYLETVLMMLEK